MLSCLDASLRTYKKGEYVFRRGEHLEHITVLVDGELHIQRDDYWGNRSIVSRVGIGEMFGEAFMAPESSAVLNDVVATLDSTVVFFDVKQIITTCSSACRFHSMVVQNLFFAISEKNRRLVQKLGHISKRSTREKLISYCRKKPDDRTAAALPSRSTVNSWQIFFRWTAAPCRMNFAKCGTKVC